MMSLRYTRKHEWRVILRAAQEKGENLYAAVLANIGGYGFDYGYDPEDDARSLQAAFAVLSEFTDPTLNSA